MRYYRVTSNPNTPAAHNVVMGTNDDGRGLWIDGQQISGVCDFRARSARELAAKLRRNNPSVKYRVESIGSPLVGTPRP